MLEYYKSWSPYNYCVNNPMRFIDPDGMKIKPSEEVLLTILNTLKDGDKVSINIDNEGYIDAQSVKEAMKTSDSKVLADLYTIASDERIVEASLSTENVFKRADGNTVREEFATPVDVNMMEQTYQDNKAMLEKQGVSKKSYFKTLESQGFEKGTSIYGNLGQTLTPYEPGKLKSSTNGNIQVIVNSKGTKIHQAVGMAHEFAHVALYLKGLPHIHPVADEYIYQRANEVKKTMNYGK